MFPHNAGIPDPSGNPGSSPRRTGFPPPVAGRVTPPVGPAEPVPPKPPGLAGTPDPSRLLQALKRRWLLALSLGLTLACLAAAGGFVALAPKNTAYSAIRLAWAKGGIIGDTAPDDRYRYTQWKQSQIGQMKSRFVLKAALNRDEVKRLNLEKKYGDVLTWLDSELKIESALDSEIVRISIMTGDPDEATVIVNAVAQAYMKEVVERDSAAKAAGVAELEKMFTQASNKLSETQKTLTKQAEELGTLDSPQILAKYQEFVRQQGTTIAQHNQVSFELLRAQGRLAAHKEMEKNLDKVVITDKQLDEAVEADPTLKAQIAQLQRYRDDIESLKKLLKNFNQEPRFHSTLRTVNDLEKRISDRRAELRKGLETTSRQRGRLEWETRLKQIEGEVAPLIVQEAVLHKEVDRLTAEVKNLGKRTNELDGLKADVARQTKIVADLGTRLEVGRYDLLAKSRVSIFGDGALLPLERKKQVMATAAGGVGCMFVAFVGVALWEFRRRRIHSTDEVSAGLGIPVVGALPASAHVEQLVVTDEFSGDPLLTESVDAIRTQLLCGARGEPARILMVTSAGAGEGKTTLASHLAASLSRAGRKTLLVDGDLRQPALHQIFEAALEPGFSEVLLGEVEPVDAILSTNIDGLMIMTAGQWDREVIQSLARDGVQGVLERLKDEFDFIVVDSHPVLSANDSLLIGKHVDAVILSVLREVSQTPKVYAASQRLTGLGIRVLGAVVNASDPEDVYASASPSYTTSAA